MMPGLMTALQPQQPPSVMRPEMKLTIGDGAVYDRLAGVSPDSATHVGRYPGTATTPRCRGRRAGTIFGLAAMLAYRPMWPDRG